MLQSSKLFLLFSLLLSGSLLAQEESPLSVSPSQSAISGVFSVNGNRSMIIEFNTLLNSSSALLKLDGQGTQETVRNAQALFKTSLSAKAQQSVSDWFKYYPGAVMSVDQETLQELKSNPAVKSIYENRIHYPTLVESHRIVNPGFAGLPVDGKGWSVVILDTGVDKRHNFFNVNGRGKVISEACYSGGGIDDFRVKSLCPGSVSATTALNSGLHCTGFDGCDHGTHVAGIAAGGSGNFSGIAPGGNIIAMQVFTGLQFLTEDLTQLCGGSSSCVVSYSSDQIKALERVYALRNTYNIAAVNMSLGGGRFPSSCAADDPAINSIITRLKNVGIATIVASGNNGFNADISAPACIPNAIAVGATSDFTGFLFGQAISVDQRAGYSNISPLLDMYAPGSLIRSSLPGNRFENFNGTSMAAPHVAGAFAVLRQAKPDMTVSEIETLLKSVGPNVSAAGISRKRLDLKAALKQMGISNAVITPFLDLLLD